MILLPFSTSLSVFVSTSSIDLLQCVPKLYQLLSLIAALPPFYSSI